MGFTRNEVVVDLDKLIILVDDRGYDISNRNDPILQSLEKENGKFLKRWIMKDGTIIDLFDGWTNETR